MLPRRAWLLLLKRNRGATGILKDINQLLEESRRISMSQFRLSAFLFYEPCSVNIF